MLSRMNEESKRDLQTDDYAIPPPSPMAVDYSNISDWIEKNLYNFLTIIFHL